MKTNFITLFLILLFIFTPIYSFESNQISNSQKYKLDDFNSPESAIYWNFSLMIFQNKLNSKSMFNIKTGITFFQPVTFKYFTNPPINMYLDNSTVKDFWCLCPPQTSTLNVTLLPNQTNMYTISFPINSAMFPNSDQYTFHIFQITLNREFSFNESVIVNGTDYSFNNFNQSYAGSSSDLNIYTSSSNPLITDSSIPKSTTLSYEISLPLIAITLGITFLIKRKK